MAKDRRERVFAGIAASGGIAIAPVFVMHEDGHTERAAGTVEEEAAALQRSLSGAASALEALSSHAGADAAEIIEFQVALLDDDDLLAPVFAAIADGVPADRAWTATLDREIAEYAAGGDDYFRARASDLADLKGRILDHLCGRTQAQAGPSGRSVIVAGDLPPSRFLEFDPAVVAGAALETGSKTSHVAILARARGIPLVVGLGDLSPAGSNDPAILDAETGRLILNPAEETRAVAEERAAALAREREATATYLTARAKTAAGKPVRVLINVDHPSILDGLDARHCDGVGLTRTEFLFQHGAAGEEAQYEAYARLIRWADGRPVTIRTLDAGGDKPVPGLTRDGETNPFLGVRGVRLSLTHPEVFQVQLRALLRAAALGPLKIMVPMVTASGEIARVRALMNRVADDLAAAGVAHAVPPLGMMVEVPVAALDAAAYDVAFYSIGSNDLIQYLTAAARDNAEVAALADPAIPAVRRLIAEVVTVGQERGAEVSLCGDMASNPKLMPLLLDCGLDAFSVAPAMLGPVKAAIAAYDNAAA